MDRFKQMQIFSAVAERGSFVAAAHALQSSKTAVSRSVSELEERLGVRLLHRTTRKLSITPEGEQFLARAREALILLDDAEAELAGARGAVAGMLRINAPVSFGIRYLADLWGEFAALNSKLQLDITLSDHTIDLVNEGVDLAIRIARLTDSSLITRKLTSTQMVLCASPRYLRKHGRPKHPSELVEHSVIGYSNAPSQDEWAFSGPQGEVRVTTRPRVVANNGDTCRAAALAHQGIVLQPDFMVGSDIESGSLVRLLPQYQADELGVYAVYASRRLMPRRVRAMIDFLVARFEKPKWMHCS